MREAVAKLKDVVAKKDIVPLLTHFVAKDGMLYAGNGNLSAAVPFPVEKNFSVRAAEFQRFLDKTPGDVKLEVLENHHVKVQCGRYRATIPGAAPSDSEWPTPTGKPYKVTDKILETLKAIRPFLSDNATQPWAACAAISGDTIYATNNVSIVRATNVGTPKESRLLITWEAIDYILSRQDGLNLFSWDDRCVGFFWKDGSWLRSPLLDFSYPDVSAVFSNVPEPKWKITDEWRDAFLHVCNISDGSSIVLHPDKITSQSESGTEITADIKKGPPMEALFTTWQIKFIQPVIENASQISIFNSGGSRISFKTPDLTGIVLGLDR